MGDLKLPKPQGLLPKKPDPKQVAIDKAAIKTILKDRYVKNFFGMPNREELIDGNNYVISRDGLYLVRKNKIGLFISRVAKTESIIPLIEDHQIPREGFHMTLERKIPHDFLLKIVAFFKKVLVEKNGAEAVIQVFYNEDTKEYFAHVGNQGVSGGGAHMDRDASLERQHLLILDVHSHNTMGSFFSGTDNRDEKEARMYGVLGRVNKPWPDMNFRAGDGKGGWIDLNVFDVFESPDVTVEVPKEWMDQVTNDMATYKARSHYHREFGPPVDNKPWGHSRGGYYKRFVPTFDPFSEDRKPTFGRVGSTEQDQFNFPFDDWEDEVGWEAADPQPEFVGDVGLAIESLVETSDILNPDESKSMWLSLLKKLSPETKDLLEEVLRNSK